ncbi:MAG TPA: hypothetical protein VJO54_14280 [Burkholderiales bacterium]|nr:hypothetical protein [Burkholderiales bacterium]
MIGPTPAELASLEAATREPVQAPVEPHEPVKLRESVEPRESHESRDSQPAPVPAPERHQPAAREPDPAEIERALRDSGLEMVQTRGSGPIELPPDAEFVPAKRERRPPPADINEPLVQVETGRPPDPKS